ncbi:MAG: ATP-binding protein [Ktedonobacterales bacterium]
MSSLPAARAARAQRGGGLPLWDRWTSGVRNLARLGWRTAQARWNAPLALAWRKRLAAWTNDPLAGIAVLLGGLVIITLVLALFNVLLGAQLPNPGTLYLPLIGMLAYHWGWKHALSGGALAIACVYFFFLAPEAHVKPLHALQVSELGVLTVATGLVLALGELARSRQEMVEREAGRFAALNRIGSSLTGELHEEPLLRTIATTARDLTGAEFAAFTLRPVDEHGLPQVPAEGNFFHLAAVVGVTPEQEMLFRHMPLGGEGVLAPIFRHGMPVKVADVLALGGGGFHHGGTEASAGGADAPGKYHASRQAIEEARDAATRYARGEQSEHAEQQLRYVGVPHGHPVVRSFLGAPLLDTDGEVRGGLLLGHSLPDHFNRDDQDLLVGLAAQAAVAIENARLYRSARTQAQELDATFESISDGIMLVDENGTILRENVAARQMREALTHTRSSDEAAALLRAVVADALSPTDGAGIARSIPVDGETERQLVIHGALLRQPPTRRGASRQESEGNGATSASASASRVVVVWRDVTATHRLMDEQRARADVETRYALLQTVINELPSGVYVVSGPDARLVLANHAAEEVWGARWPRGQTMREFLRASGTRMFGPDGRELALDDLATLRAVRSGVEVRHHQEVIRQSNGIGMPVLLNAVALDARTLSLSITPPPDDDGRAAAQAGVENSALVVLQDVTNLKEGERLKDDFIGVAAHELRTPLAALKGFAEMLSVQTARGKGQHLDDWQQEALDAIDLSTTRLVELIDDLLDVTRLQGGRLEVHLEPHDLVALVRRVLRRMGVVTDHHHIEIVAAAEYVVARVDPLRIEQVVSNLLSNAIKYSPDGGEVTVEVRRDEAAGEAVIAVRDHGIGIPPEQQSQLFGRFVRADNARGIGISGTGLGLYLSRELVERHGGRIWFDSAEGVGSAFFVALPLEAPDEDDHLTSSAPQSTAAAGESHG